MNTGLSDSILRGRQYIIVNEWGPYNFHYPELVLRNREYLDEREVFTFAVFGPEGTWSVRSVKGFDAVSHQSGTVPDTLVAWRMNDSGHPELILEFAGVPFTDQFGNGFPGGAGYELHYLDREIRVQWDIAFYQYDSHSDPMTNPGQFEILLAATPIASEKRDRLGYRWWREPIDGVSADQFAIRATADIVTTPGEYLFQVESDDGIRLWIDGDLILERWDVHTPVIDEVTVALTEGRHHVEIEYFEATGLAVLDVSILHQ
jgi:hypothetical protein